MINQFNVIVRETKEEDLEHILALWNDGDVMKFVGFPNGLHETKEGMEKWYSWIEKSRPGCNHYSVFADDIGYCGETFFHIDREHENHASLDIKLFSKARGKGIATTALSYAIKEAFSNGAKAVWVDPNPANEKALALYTRLGFTKKEMPDYLKEDDPDFSPVYMELEKEQWETVHNLKNEKSIGAYNAIICNNQDENETNEIRKRKIRRYEEMAINAFPALLTEIYDGWVLRYSNGYTYRGNSVYPLFSSSIDFDKKIEECERRYEEKGIKVVFKVTDATDEGLTELLYKRGYEKQKSADVMAMKLEQSAKETEGVEIAYQLTEEWLNQFVILDGADKEPEKSTAMEMLSKIGNPLICASISVDGEMAGCALGVVEDGELGIFDLRVKEAYRRRGFATKICNAILEKGVMLGAKQAYLQVMGTNEKAQGLYKKLGFSKEYTYSYLVK